MITWRRLIGGSHVLSDMCSIRKILFRTIRTVGLCQADMSQDAPHKVEC